ncbi:ABC transporter permease [Candidatus Woesebacteria bacterium]|nr:ABC transporter permease [Candidatus Woesebacteria bacterium]
MEFLTFILKSSFFDFSRNKGRTFLTSLGILIGVMAVVLLTAFGLGLRAYIEQQFEDLGSNLVRVVPGQILKDGSFSNSSSAFTSIEFDEKDVQQLGRIREVKEVVPVYSRTLAVVFGNKKESSTLYSSTAGIFSALNVKADFGTLYTDQDVDKRSKSIVIGPILAEKLFLSSKSAVGKTVKIEGQSYTVIGVANKKGGGFGGPDFDSFTYMPYKTAFTFNKDKTFMALILQARQDKDMKSIIRQTENTLLKRYEEDEFSVIQQEELLSAIGSIFSIINTVLVAIAAISLVVGGIGIMNIMYVTVTERIKEIGIRRALGARKSDILWQFLVESVILSLLGGAAGLGVSYIIILFVQAYFPAYIDLNSVVLALGVSSAIGIIFGVFPAKKAADLSPIEAIRYE